MASKARHRATIPGANRVAAWYGHTPPPRRPGRHRRPGLITRMVRATGALVQAVMA